MVLELIFPRPARLHDGVLSLPHLDSDNCARVRSVVLIGSKVAARFQMRATSGTPRGPGLGRHLLAGLWGGIYMKPRMRMREIA